MMRMIATGLIGSTALVLAACATDNDRLEIRPLKSAASAKNMPVPARLAEANAQFALGNVALALELYRKASREDVASTQAFVGIARCYQRMGRTDLARQNYESALAIAPQDDGILAELAGSLNAAGLTSEARSILAELEIRRATDKLLTSELQGIALPVLTDSVAPHAPATQTIPQRAARLEVVSATNSSVTVRLPPAQRPASATLMAAEVSASPVAASSVTITLPPPRPAGAASLAAPMPASKPRLERTSLNEVSLVTNPQGPRFVELKSTSRAPGSLRFSAFPEPPRALRVLNAARVRGLAANTRAYLAQRGWRAINLGNSAKLRSTSILLYPTGRQTTARRLASQFKFAVTLKPTAGPLTLVLGRDAALFHSKAKRA